jgi:hypothetical protein
VRVVGGRHLWREWNRRRRVARLAAEMGQLRRHLDDTMWLGRAHSIGHARQHLNLLGFALTVNSLALHRHRREPETVLAA